MLPLNKQDAVLEVDFWATPAPHLTLDQLIEEMKEVGNTVLEVDRENNRLLLARVKQEGLLG